MNTLINMLGKYGTSAYWSGFASAMLGVFLSFMAPVWPFVFLALVLVVSDIYSGVKAAQKRGEKIRSRGLYRGVEKFTLYFLAITVGELVRVTFFPIVPVTQVVAFGICITEFFSMVENVEVVTGVNIIRRLKKIIPGLTAEDLEEE